MITRKVTGLTRAQCAAVLGVGVRTVRNWERGRTAIPYSAFKLLRITCAWELPGEWSEFTIRRGVLWSPEGKPFYAWEMSWLSLVFRMARHWMADRGWKTIDLPAQQALKRAQAVKQDRGAQAPAPGNPRPRTGLSVPPLADISVVGERSLPGRFEVVTQGQSA